MNVVDRTWGRLTKEDKQFIADTRRRLKSQPGIVKCVRCEVVKYWYGCPIFKNCRYCQNTRLNAIPFTELEQ